MLMNFSLRDSRDRATVVSAVGAGGLTGISCGGSRVVAVGFATGCWRSTVEMEGLKCLWKGEILVTDIGFDGNSRRSLERQSMPAISQYSRVAERSDRFMDDRQVGK